MIFKRKNKKLFIFKRATDLLSVKGRRTLRIGDQEFYVFHCGEHTVVYKRDQEFFNSAREGIPYSTWLKQYKREKGITKE